MAIRDVSNLPDDQVPEWVRRSRERKRQLADPSFRKGPTMGDYREDLRRFGPPPRFTVAERLAVLATGTEALVESDPEDGTGTLVKVSIREVTYDGSKLFSAAAILGVTLRKESSNGQLRWYRILRPEVTNAGR